MDDVVVQVARLQASITTHLGDGPSNPGHVYQALSGIRGQLDMLATSVGRLKGQFHGDSESGATGLAHRLSSLERASEKLAADMSIVITSLSGSMDIKSPGLLVRLAAVEVGLAKVDDRSARIDAALNEQNPQSPGVILQLDRMTQRAETTRRWLWLVTGGLVTGAVKLIADWISR